MSLIDPNGIRWVCQWTVPHPLLEDALFPCIAPRAGPEFQTAPPGTWTININTAADVGSFGSLRVHAVYEPSGGPDGPQDDCGTGADASAAGAAIEIPAWNCRGALAGLDAIDEYSFAADAGERVRAALTSEPGTHLRVCLLGPGPKFFSDCGTTDPLSVQVQRAGQQAGVWKVQVFGLSALDRGYYTLSAVVGELKACGLSRTGFLATGLGGAEVEGISARTEGDLGHHCGGAPFILGADSLKDSFGVCWRDSNGAVIQPPAPSYGTTFNIPDPLGCKRPPMPTEGDIPLNAVAARIIHVGGFAGSYTLTSA